MNIILGSVQLIQTLPLAAQTYQHCHQGLLNYMRWYAPFTLLTSLASSGKGSAMHKGQQLCQLDCDIERAVLSFNLTVHALAVTRSVVVSRSLHSEINPFKACFDPIPLLLIHIQFFPFQFTSICLAFTFLSLFSLTAAPWVSISLRSLVIFIQTLMGCFPPKRLVVLGLATGIVCSVTVYVTLRTCQHCVSATISVHVHALCIRSSALFD